MVIFVGQVGELFDDGTVTRSCVDNNHHPEQFILLTDCNPYSQEGDLYYQMDDEGNLIGNYTKKKI